MTQNEELCGQFINWLSIGHSRETVQSYRCGLRQFIQWMNKSVLIAQDQDFINYCVHLKNERHLKNGALSCRMAALRTFWRFLYDRRLTQTDWRSIPSPKVNDRVHYPAAKNEDIKMIIDSLDSFFPDQLRDKTIISLLRDTGIRIGEALSVNIDDINLIEKKAMIKTLKRQDHYREVYWGDETNGLLQSWINIREKILKKATKNTEALFVSISNNSYGERAKKHAIQKLFCDKRRDLRITSRIS